MVPCRSVYNCILGRLSTTTLDALTLSTHLKLKHYNLQGDPVTINVNLEGEKRIYQALQRDQGEGKLMEINMTSIIGQLRSMSIYPPRSG